MTTSGFGAQPTASGAPGYGHREPTSYWSAHLLVRHKTGIVIPVYVSPAMDADLARALVEDTTAACVDLVDDPSRVCLSVDGPGAGAGIAERLGVKHGVSVTVSRANRGKLQGARGGARSLLQRPELNYLAIVDQDGDHFANELVNLVRAAEHVRACTCASKILVLGCRSSRHRPMGFLRGEQEELADRMLLDALRYHGAVSGRPPRLEFVTTVADVPDFHSGFKLFSRPCASDTLLTEPVLAGVSPDCYYRHAVEAVMVVESVASGAVLAAVNRSTFNGQPVSTFGNYERCRLVADMIVWPCKRLGVPGAFVAQWLADQLPPLLLNTLVPEGRDELERIAELVLEPFGLAPRSEGAGRLGPLFI